MIVVGTSAATLLAGLAAVAWRLTTAARRPTFRLVATGEEPLLTLPSGGAAVGQDSLHVDFSRRHDRRPHRDDGKNVEEAWLAATDKPRRHSR